MKRPAIRKLALVLAIGAAGSWAWILARGGLVEHPPRKPDRGARAAASEPEVLSRSIAGERGSSTTSNTSDLDPASRVSALEARVDALVAARARPERAGVAGLDLRLSASFAAPAVARAAPDELDAELAAFLAQSPLEGTHVRGTLRIASFGGRVLREGDELVQGRARLERIEPGGVVVDCRGRRVRVAFAGRATEGAK